MLTVLGDLAEFERELICSRTSEGRERAKAGSGVGPKIETDAAPAEGSDSAAGSRQFDIGRSYKQAIHRSVGSGPPRTLELRRRRTSLRAIAAGLDVQEHLGLARGL